MTNSDSTPPVSAISTWPHDDWLHAWWVEPGRILAGECPSDDGTSPPGSRVELLVDHGIRTFVDLTAPDDGLPPYAHHVASIAERRGLDLRHERRPIRDFGVTTDAAYDDIVATIRRVAERGAVYVHCWGGVGRTGTVIGCFLLDGGLDYDATSARLAELRAGTRKAQRVAPESPAQLDVLRRRAARAGPS